MIFLLPVQYIQRCVDQTSLLSEKLRPFHDPGRYEEDQLDFVFDRYLAFACYRMVHSATYPFGNLIKYRSEILRTAFNNFAKNINIMNRNRVHKLAISFKYCEANEIGATLLSSKNIKLLCPLILFSRFLLYFQFF